MVTPANFGVNGADGFYCHPLAGEYDAVTDGEGCNAGADILGHGTFVASVASWRSAGSGVGGERRPRSRRADSRHPRLHGGLRSARARTSPPESTGPSPTAPG
ncbi:MAG: hypothetical protein R2862_02755 [Thermoanaerobaculia bacterium]